MRMRKKEKEFRKAAKRGNAKDKYNLGWMYQDGSEVPQNYKKAVKWYRKAAKQGDADAQNNLGWMYEKGNGVRKSNVNACMWYKRAMEQGQDRARTNYNKLVQNMAPKARARAEAKAEGKMAYVKQRIKSFFKWVIWLVVLMILCAFIISWLFPKSPVTPAILDVKEYLLDKTDQWSNDQKIPPSITLEKRDFTWLSGLLYGKETDTLSIRIRNHHGYARDMIIELSSSQQGLSFPHSTLVPTIPKDGEKIVNIPISGEGNLPDTRASIDFELVTEWPDITYKRRLSFLTREFRKPQLRLVSAAVSETIKKISNNKIEPSDNEKIDLKFYVQNKGCNAAEDVKIMVNNNQTGVTFLGIGDDFSKNPPIFLTIDAGEFELITYHYIVTSNFKDSELEFKISATEGNNYGLEEETVTIPLDNLKSLDMPEKVSCNEDTDQDLRVEYLKNPDQETQVIAERENDMQQSLWEPGIQLPDRDLDPPPPMESSFEYLNLSDVEISGDMFTSHNPAPFNRIKLEFSIQNVYGPMKQVEVQVKNDQKGADPFKPDPKKFSTIGSQERKPITYEYWIDGEEFNDHEFKFEIHVTYQYRDIELINGTTIKEKWEPLEQKWEIKRQVAPYSEVEVISLP